jgi:hypothetical protein
VSTPGFGDATAGHLRSLAEFNGYLYAGLLQTQTIYQPPNYLWRVQIWRSSSGNPGTWSLAYEYADVTSNYHPEAAEALVEFENQLYCLLAPWDVGSPRLIRTANGTDWTEVTDFGLQCGGFGYTEASAAVLHGHLYALSFYSYLEGGPLCRSEDGSVWEPVTLPNGNWVTALDSALGVLYAGHAWAGVAQTIDGLNWDYPGPSELYDPVQALGVFERSLYVGTRDLGGGCEVWRYPVLDPCFVDGFESGDTAAWSGSVP